MTEYWIMRVIGRATPEVVASPQVRADIDRGALCVTGGELCEPLESYRDAEQAHVRMGAIAARSRAGCAFKLTMSTDEF